MSDRFKYLDISYDDKEWGNIINPNEWNDNFHEIEQWVSDLADDLNAGILHDEDKEIFIAEYGTTTFDEIEDAIEAGKVCIAKRNNVLYLLVNNSGSSPTVFKHFYSFRVDSGTIRIDWLQCDNNDTWSMFFGTTNLLNNVVDSSNGGISVEGKIIAGRGPTNNMDVATKLYVDDSIENIDALPPQTGKNGKYLQTNGSTASWESIPDFDDKVDKSGDTMTGPLTLPSDPTSGLHAATKRYVDNSIPDMDSFMVKGADYVTAGKSDNTTLGDYATAEGYNVTASGNFSHGEGRGTTASGLHSHAEGFWTTGSGIASHAEGVDTIASGLYSHAENGETTASGDRSHAEGKGTIAQRACQHVFGKYNVADSHGSNGSDFGKFAEIVGKGTNDSSRSNARTLDWDGNEVLAGKITVGVGPTEDMDVATKKYVDEAVGDILKSPNGTKYKLSVDNDGNLSTIAV